jgi:hypothetical protein
MNKKFFIFVLVIFVFCLTGIIFAQSSKQNAAQLISRAENIADKAERLVERTKTRPTTKAGENELIRLSRDYEDESATLSNDIAFANLTDVPFTDQQMNRLMNATRRITNANSQISRNISRWNQ